MSDSSRDDELVSAALDGDEQASAAVRADAELVAALERLRSTRSRLTGHVVSPPPAVREANLAAALAAFDDMTAAASQEQIDADAESVPVVELATRRGWRDRLGVPSIGVAAAAAAVVAVLITLNVTRSGNSDSVADSGDATHEPSSEPLSRESQSSADDSASDSADDASGGAADAAVAMADEIQASPTVQTSAAGDSIASTQEDENSGADGTLSAEAPLEADFGPLDPRFIACRSELQIDGRLPTRAWRNTAQTSVTVDPAAPNSTDMSTISPNAVALLVRDDTGVVYSVVFDSATCTLESSELVATP